MALLFDVYTPLNFPVRITPEYWAVVTAKHPVMRGREDVVREALANPDEIRRSVWDPAVLLFYRLERPGRWTCAVARRLGDDGFLITTYPTEAIKAGERIWTR